MNKYDPKTVEPKWQQAWADTKLYAATNGDATRPKYYMLTEFPYPSGDGLHAGHAREYTLGDVIARHKRMQGYNVLYPMGYDAFGLPTENFAIKHKIRPQDATAQNMASFRKQFDSLGFSFDWDRQVNTTDPAYYRWTQWLFLQFLKKDLAYQAEMPINWCPKCKTGLANEEVVDGKHERCGTPVEKKLLKQWMLKITAYADRLIDGLKSVDYPSRIADQQINWIGRSEGAEIVFPLAQDEKLPQHTYVLIHGFNGEPADFSWIKLQLEEQGHKVIVPTMPNPSAPIETEWVETVLKAADYDENTTLVGYSLGSVAALKALEKLDGKVSRLILAGGFIDPEFADDHRPFETTFKWQFDTKAILSKVGSMKFVHDTTDTAISMGQAQRLSKLFNVPLTYVQAKQPHFTAVQEPTLLNALMRGVTVFTTRPDTLFGATFLVASPEVALAWMNEGWQADAKVRDYVTKALRESELERQEEKKKTGIDTGLKAVHPLSGELVPVWVADYVLGSYGTGAIMAVPAHDERDHDFATAFDLPVKQVVMPHVIDTFNPPREGAPNTTRTIIQAIVKHPDKDEIISLRWRQQPWHTLITGGVEAGEDIVQAAQREIREETGYINLKYVKRLPYAIQAEFFAAHKEVNRRTQTHFLYFELQNLEREPIAEDEAAKHDIEWIKQSDIHKLRPVSELSHVINWLDNGDQPYSGEGPLMNSDKFDGLEGVEAKRAIVKELFEKGAGHSSTKYRLRDWIFSRQHYWGEPIPVVHCAKDGVVPVPEDQLPVTLPDVDSYEPTDTGESPLAAITDWVNTSCPTCGGPAQRETDTMPNWAGSSWYYLRYMDPHNNEAFASREALDYWGNVDLYLGGTEHITLHLLYSRFWHQFLHDQGLVPTPEPYAARRGQGIVLADDGRKMSKSLGNVINPNDVIARYGADAFRLYVLFMAPYDESTAWSDERLNGVSRFVYRVHKLAEDLMANRHPLTGPTAENTGEVTTAVDRLTHKTLKKVHHDLHDMRFNTMVAALMEYVNGLSEPKIRTALTRPEYAELAQRTLRSLVLMLAPSTPHLAEELWHHMGETGSVHVAGWPKYDPQLIEDDLVTIVVQVNGKVRANLIAAVDASEADLTALAQADANVAKYLAEGELVKTVVVPRRLVNFVIR